MKMRKTFSAICCLAAAMMVMTTSTAQAGIIVDLTSTGGNTGGNMQAASFTFAASDSSGIISFDVTVAAVIPANGGQNGGQTAKENAGIGSRVENTGDFLNVIDGVPEVLEFTIGNLTGLNPGQSLELVGLLSQNGNSLNADQSGGSGAVFGQVSADSVTLVSDNGSSVVINQSDLGDQGAILLNTDNGNTTNTGNTFLHAGALTFTNSFTLRLTDLADNQGIQVQGFEFAVTPAAVPEPSSASLLGLVGLAMLGRRRKRRLA